MTDFQNLKISTMTMCVEWNFKFDLKLLVDRLRNNYYPETDLILCTKEAIVQTRKNLIGVEYLRSSEFKSLTFPIGTISKLNYGATKLGKIKKTKQTTVNTFRNQVSMDIFVETNKRVNVMVFVNGKIKLAGCQTTNHGIGAMLCLSDYLRIHSLVADGYNLEFVMSSEMINVTYLLPFQISKTSTYRVFSRKNFCQAFYERTGQQNVNVKFSTSTNFFYRTVVKLNLSKKIVEFEEKEVLKRPKTTFMIFPKRIIISGIDYSVMEGHFKDLLDILLENEKELRC